MIKVIVAGGRGFTDREGLLKAFHDFMEPYKNEQIVIVSGGARGADAIGEWIGKEYGITTVIMRAQWDKFGKSAGYRRNEQMAQYATHLLAAWDGASKGTKHMIDIATKAGLTVQIHSYQGESVEC